MHLTLISPAGIQFQETIEYFVVESKSVGDFAVFENHVPVIASLDYATVKLVTKSQTLYVVVINGNLEMMDNQATLIAQEANVGKTKEDALSHLLEVRDIRIKENRQRQIDFLKAENELKKTIKSARAGNL
jgi:F-type H+-transporting ATPase subunit epsilon